MNRIFDKDSIIQVYLDLVVVVDKNQTIEANDWYYNLTLKELNKAIDHNISQFRYEEGLGIDRRKVIATLGNANLSGVPKIVIQDMEVQANKFAQLRVDAVGDKWGKDAVYHEAFNGFVSGWNAKKNQFTEQDMIDCYLAGFHHQLGGDKLLEEQATDYVKALIKCPSYLILDFEERSHISGGLRPMGEIGGKGLQRHTSFSLVSENNEVHPVHVGYE